MSVNAPTICTFESRRANEMRSLIERFGGVAVVAPSMQEVPLTDNAAAFAAIEQILDGGVSYIVLLTGVGTEAMLNVAAARGCDKRLLDAMGQLPLIVRGPKPAAVLAKLGLKYAVKAPEPNTWKELLAAIDAEGMEISRQLVAVQEYGVPNPELCRGLEERGADVLAIPVYRWALPDNVEPLKQAINRTIAGEVDALLFTSAQQVRHVLQVADQTHQRTEWLDAATRCIVGSIGPTCSEALRVEGLSVSFEASPPKMGPLVRGVLERIT